MAPWFHGSLSRTEADAMLTKPAMFIVRYSEKFPVSARTTIICATGVLLTAPARVRAQTKLTLVYSKTKENTLQFKNCLIHNTCELCVRSRVSSLTAVLAGHPVSILTPWTRTPHRSCSRRCRS